MKKSENRYPAGWGKARIRRVSEHYDLQTEEASAAAIEAGLINDADDPEAWEEPITVTPSDAPRPDWYGRTGRIDGNHKVARRQKGTILTRKKKNR